MTWTRRKPIHGGSVGASMRLTVLATVCLALRFRVRRERGGEGKGKSKRKNKGAFRRLCSQTSAVLLQPLATVATALATYSRLFWFSAATQMRPVPTA